MTANLVETVRQAQRRAAARPRVNGFAYYAEALREAGITAVETSVATGGSIYHLAGGAVAQTSDSMAAPVSAVPDWDEDALVAAIRADQAGRTSFPAFLADSWRAGVIRFRVDLTAHTCTYFGAAGQHYVEAYPAVALD